MLRFLWVLHLFAYVSIVLHHVHVCCITVTWWGEPGDIESYLGHYPPSFSALTLLVGSSDQICKNVVPEMKWVEWDVKPESTQLNQLSLIHRNYARSSSPAELTTFPQKIIWIDSDSLTLVRTAVCNWRRQEVTSRLWDDMKWSFYFCLTGARILSPTKLTETSQLYKSICTARTSKLWINVIIQQRITTIDHNKLGK